MAAAAHDFKPPPYEQVIPKDHKPCGRSQLMTSSPSPPTHMDIAKISSDLDRFLLA